MIDLRAEYTTLGLEPGAGSAAIRAAYRRLARECHPDVNRSPDASERMRQINIAYAVILAHPTSDPAPASPPPPVEAVRPTPAVTPPDSQPASVGSVRSVASWYRPMPASGVSRGAYVMPAVASEPSATWMAGGQRFVTVGVVGGFCLLVVALATWALMVTRPLQGISGPVSGSSSAASTGAFVGTGPITPVMQSVAQSTTGTLASQASANAAANAAAARNNVSVTGAAGTNASHAAVASTASGAAPSGASPALSDAARPAQAVTPAAPVAPAEAAGSTAPRIATTPARADADTTPPTGSVAAPAAQQRQVMPSLPAISGGRADAAPAGQHIQSVGNRQAFGNSAAVRALSGYDQTWTVYAGAVRAAAAGSLLSAASPAIRSGSVGASSAAAVLSGDSQLTLTRSLYFQQQLAWNQHAGMVLAAAGELEVVSRPDGSKAARADLRLRQAADLVTQAQSSGVPVAAAQVKALVDEAETLHREWVAEWAALLGALSALAAEG